MPRVPSYDNLQTAPGVAPVREFQAPAIRNFGAEGLQDAGRGLMQATGPFAKMVREKQDEADQIRVLEAEDTLERARLKLLYDPERGALSRKGADALNAGDRPLPQLYGEQFDKAVSEIANGLGNDRQKMAFQAAAQRRATQFRGDLTRHVAREFERHREGVLTGAIDTSVQGAAAEWGNVERVAEHAARARQAAGALALSRGLAGNEGKELERKAVSGVHEAVIANALAGQKLDYAREYFDQHTDELDANARLRLTQALERGAKDERVYSHVDRIWGVSRGNLTGALRAARDSVPADLRSEVEARLRQYNADAKASQAQGERAAKDAAWDYVARTGGFEGMPENIRARLGGEDELRLRDYVLNRAAQMQAIAERSFKSDEDVRYGLLRMYADDPASFANLDLREAQPKLETRHYDELVRLQIGVNKADAKAMNLQRTVKQATTAFRQDIAAAGIDLSSRQGKSQRETERAALFSNALHDAIAARIESKGSALTHAEQRETVMSLLREYHEQPSGLLDLYNPTVRAYALPTDPAERDQFIWRPLDEIPPEVVEQITNAFRAKYPMAGNPPPSEIEREYARAMRAGAVDPETGLMRTTP